MNDRITLNECLNDGSTIHAYYNPVAGAWFTYGISAFLLKELCKSHDILAIESYSEFLQMPCAFVVDIIDVSKHAVSSLSGDSSCRVMTVSGNVEDEDYISWASNLRKLQSNLKHYYHGQIMDC